ncbi:MAG: endonuclease/exonuclease/phosphatase family protein [Candidatus Binatia bacterium]|nr:endonuclease/exonuclease/phosphatase family protein [Candidatus Binatia bacterium]
MTSWMGPPALALGILLALPPQATAVDVPVAGQKLRLKASATNAKARKLSVVLKDDAISAPFADPSLGSRIVVSGGAETGHCYAEIELDPAGWQPLGGSGPVTGWKYRPVAAQPGGVRKVLIRDGRITISAKGESWPCDLAANAQRLPVSVRLEIDGVRYCASFGGTVKRNESGRVLAKAAPAPAGCAEKNDITVVNLNLLHGLFCTPLNCRQSDRVDLLYDWISGTGCPDVVTLQEIWTPMVPLIQAQLGTACPFTYEMAVGTFNNVDDAITLSRYPIGISEVIGLFPGFRNVLYTRIDHTTGPIDVFTTHLASSADDATGPCGGTCPTECVNAGAATVRECQSVQLAAFVEARHDVPTSALITGDFNAEPGEFEYLQMTDRGWIDTWVEAGATCDLVTGIGCGSNRNSSLVDLESPAVTSDERIDFIFRIPPQSATCSVDSPTDSDGDGVATTMWADQANPFEACGPLPLAMCWPSDHNGNQLDLECS